MRFNRTILIKYIFNRNLIMNQCARLKYNLKVNMNDLQSLQKDCIKLSKKISKNVKLKKKRWPKHGYQKNKPYCKTPNLESRKFKLNMNKRLVQLKKVDLKYRKSLKSIDYNIINN